MNSSCWQCLVLWVGKQAPLIEWCRLVYPPWCRIEIIFHFFLIYFQQDATSHILFISGKLLYMFRVVSPPIIRSTQLYWQYLVLVIPLLLPAAIVEEVELVWVLCGNCIDLFWCCCASSAVNWSNQWRIKRTRSCCFLLVLSLCSELQLLVIFSRSSLLNSCSDKQQFFRPGRIRLTFWPITRRYGKMYEAFVSGLEFEIFSLSFCPVLNRVRLKYFGCRRSDSHWEGTRF